MNISKKISFLHIDFRYLKFIDKLYGICDNSCQKCKSNSEYCRGYCHKFFCNDCFGAHICKSIVEIYDLNYINQRDTYFKKNFNDEKIKLKNSINDYPKDWKICECKKDKVLSYCEHGLKCKKC